MVPGRLQVSVNSCGCLPGEGIKGAWCAGVAGAPGCLGPLEAGGRESNASSQSRGRAFGGQGG